MSGLDASAASMQRLAKTINATTFNIARKMRRRHKPGGRYSSGAAPPTLKSFREIFLGHAAMKAARNKSSLGTF